MTRDHPEFLETSYSEIDGEINGNETGTVVLVQFVINSFKPKPKANYRSM